MGGTADCTELCERKRALMSTMRKNCGINDINDARYVKMFSSDFNHVEFVDVLVAAR
jgi:hypothetical protein